MDIDIDRLSIHVEVKHRKWKLMLHRKILISILQRLGYHGTLYISAVHEKVFKITISSCNDRFSQISCDVQSAFFIIHLKKVCRDIPAVNIIDHVFEFPVPCRTQLFLVIALKVECHFRMGQGEMYEQILHVSRLSDGSLQKFPSGRHIVKKLMHKEGCTVGRARLLKRNFPASLDDILCPELIICFFGNEFCPRHSSNTGECLSAESQGTDVQKIFYISYFARRVTQERALHFIMGNTASVVCNTDKINPAVLDLYSHRSRASVDRVLHQFFNDRRRAFDHFSCSDLIDCHLIQYLNMRHVCLLFLNNSSFFRKYRSAPARSPAVFQLILQPVYRIERINGRHISHIKIL